MKKKYIQPTVKMHSVSTSRMVAMSELDYSNTQGTEESGITTNDGKEDLDFGW